MATTARSYIRLVIVALTAAALWQCGRSVGGSSYLAAGDAEPAADTCAVVEEIPSGYLGARPGSTRGQRDDAAGSCGGAGGPDHVFRVSTTSAATLALSVRPRDLEWRAVLHVRSACDSAAAELGCVAAEHAGGAALLVLHAQAPGTYYVWVDSAAGTAGDFDLEINAMPRAGGDLCAAAIDLLFAAAEVSVAGSTAGRVDDATGSCSGGGADVVFRVTPTAPANLDAVLTAAGASAEPALYLRADCLSGELACGAAAAGRDVASLRAGNLDAGTPYWLFVDSAADSLERYAFVVHLTPPLVGDVCGNPVPLDLVLDGSTAVEGDTSPFFNDSRAPCEGSMQSGGPDLVYSFTTTEVADLRLALQATGAQLYPLLHLERGTCPGQSLGCDGCCQEGSRRIEIHDLPADTYYVWVDGTGSSPSTQTSGPYTLVAQLLTPVAGDTCNDPLPLDVSSGSASAVGDTTALFNDAVSSVCTASGPDRVYSFVTTATLDITVSLTATSVGYSPSVYVRRGNCGGSEVGCAGGSSNPATVTLTAQPADVYYVWVDGTSQSAGAYVLQVSFL